MPSLGGLGEAQGAETPCEPGYLVACMVACTGVLVKWNISSAGPSQDHVFQDLTLIVNPSLEERWV